MTTARRTKKTIVNASNAAEIERMLRIPRRTVAAFDSPAKVRQAFSLPVSLGAPKEEREALDMAFDSAGDTLPSGRASSSTRRRWGSTLSPVLSATAPCSR